MYQRLQQGDQVRIDIGQLFVVVDHFTAVRLQRSDVMRSVISSDKGCVLDRILAGPLNYDSHLVLVAYKIVLYV